MKVVSQDALTKLIQLSKDNFIDKNDTVQATTVQLATVATTGDYEDLNNTPPAIPSQTGQSGKFLTTDGTDVSWATVSAAAEKDNKSITLNGSNQLQTVGVINQNSTTTAIKTWSGTLAQYNAIATKDANTLYNITDDVAEYEDMSDYFVHSTGNETIAGTKTFSTTPLVGTVSSTSDNSTKAASTEFIINVLKAIYPVGSYYIGTMSDCPMASFFGTWTKVGTTILTNVTGSNSVPVKGSGKTLGLTNGSTNGGMVFNRNGYMSSYSNLYGTAVGTSGSSLISQTLTSLGVTTDASNSGIVADISSSLTKSSLTVNIWERTA